MTTAAARVPGTTTVCSDSASAISCARRSAMRGASGFRSLTMRRVPACPHPRALNAIPAYEIEPLPSRRRSAT